MEKFTPEEKTKIQDKIQNEQSWAHNNALYNQKVDIWFKVAILAISLLIIVSSAIATSETSQQKKWSPYWSLASTILGGASTVLSAFAFSQFNFEKRHRTWQKKADGYKSLIFQINYLDPDKDLFLKQLQTVDSWGDYTDPDEIGLDKIQNDPNKV